VLYVGDDEQIAPVEQEIRDLSAGLQLVKDEQAYLVVRERVHRDSESLLYVTRNILTAAAESTVRSPSCLFTLLITFSCPSFPTLPSPASDFYMTQLLLVSASLLRSFVPSLLRRPLSFFYHPSTPFCTSFSPQQNSRIKYWAIVQIIILFGICALNVHVLKSWFEVKRVL